MKKFERDPTVGSLDTDFLSRYSSPFGGMAPTGHRQRVVPIPRNFMENNLQKHVKKFERDPTVRSLDTDFKAGTLVLSVEWPRPDVVGG